MSAGGGRGPVPPTGSESRRIAIEALVRISADGAYANLVLGPILDRSALSSRDRGFVTDLVYGTTRMQRACDHLIARHRDGPLDDPVRAALRVGSYQLAMADTAAHAAVDATVSATPRRARGLVNAVLRRIADDVQSGIEWPDDGTRLSYPDWIVDELAATVGRQPALDALARMNRPAQTHLRADGYVQDLASVAVVERVGAQPGELVLDLCAAPGGKATGLAESGADVIAADSAMNRATLITANATRVGARLPVVVADGARSPFLPGTFDRVLVDAPCTGLGVLRRRPDARWRIDAAAPRRLAQLQVALVAEAVWLTRPGGAITYSVCTLTRGENDGVADEVCRTEDVAELGRERILPTDASDGMFICTWTKQRA